MERLEMYLKPFEEHPKFCCFCSSKDIRNRFDTNERTGGYEYYYTECNDCLKSFIHKTKEDADES